MAKIDELRDAVSDQLKKVRKQKRELENREKDLMLELSIEKDIDQWKTIMDAKNACKKILQESKLKIHMTLTKLDNFPDYYIYQHPTNKKLKTDNRNEEWVRKCLGEIPMGAKGGAQHEESELLATARKSRLSAWKRALKKKTRKAKVLASGNRPEDDQISVVDV